ncbi:hypothetical protein DNTS_021685 [Danionella cerebrum]|uniref:Uncharacterized protein n=1 Tax=Danionella cerebrum TaxID=2873325 RepID=A0A553N3I4_9TELE|nr:hypothetical protein DNTS_021685 [Danionella translucida]
MQNSDGVKRKKGVLAQALTSSQGRTGEGHAEEGDEEVADRQGADEDVGGGAQGSFVHKNIDHQTVPDQRQRKDDRVHHHEGALSSGGERGDVDKGLDVVGVDEFLAGEVVEAQEFLKHLRSDLRGGSEIRHEDF